MDWRGRSEVSNYTLDQIDQLTQATGVTPEVNQIRWGTSIYDTAVVTGLQQRGVVLEGYSPFKASNLDDPTLVSIASSHDATTAQIVIAWHVAHDFVVIPKSVRRGANRGERRRRQDRAHRRRADSN